jgi:hypothetical protein
LTSTSVDLNACGQQSNGKASQVSELHAIKEPALP